MSGRRLYVGRVHTDATRKDLGQSASYSTTALQPPTDSRCLLPSPPSTRVLPPNVVEAHFGGMGTIVEVRLMAGFAFLEFEKLEVSTTSYSPSNGRRD